MFVKKAILWLPFHSVFIPNIYLWYLWSFLYTEKQFEWSKQVDVKGDH